jgi:hypothetical protein
MEKNIEESQPPQDTSRVRVRVPLKLFILIGVLILLTPLVFLLSQKSTDTPKGTKEPQGTFAGYQVGRTHDELQNCEVTKDGNPIVEHVQKIQDFIVGSYRGNINEYSYSPSNNTASLLLISPKGDQTQLFSLKGEKGLVFDAITMKEISLADLKRGQTVSISFNCFPKENNEFKITRINLTGKI